MKMDEVKGGVKVFSAGAADEPADEEGMRVYRRLRRNQSEGNGTGAAGAASAAAAKKRRSWKASEPVTAIGDLRTTRSDAAAAVTTATTTTAVVARRGPRPWPWRAWQNPGRSGSACGRSCGRARWSRGPRRARDGS